MADSVAAPSGATSKDTSDASKEKTAVVKPERPNEEEFKANVSKAEKELGVAQERMNKIRGKLEIARPAKDSPTSKRQQEFRSQLASIRQEQQGLKGSRTNIIDKIKRLDDQLKSRIADNKAARARSAYKSTEDIDREIARLQKQVDTGMMKLVDEKKALAEITSLYKQRKGFAAFDQQQKGIDDVKAQISELKKQLEDPEYKALSEKYTKISKELDEIRTEQDEAYKNLNGLRDERTKAYAEQQEKANTVKEIKDKYFQAKRDYAAYEREANQKRRERIKAERDAHDAEKRRQAAKEKLDEAGAPAYQDEMIATEGLIRYFDPSYKPEKSSVESSKFAAEARRTVDAEGIKGTRLARKDEAEENYFVGKAGKKSKKGRKGGGGGDASASANASTPQPSSEGKYNLPLGVIEELSRVGIEPPMTQADVSSVTEKLKSKLDGWKKDQDRKTKENIAKAQKEIDRLDVEAKSSADGSVNDAAKASINTSGSNGVNGSSTVEVTNKLEKTSLVDGETKA